MATSGDQDVREEDRLPWLETVEEDRDTGPSAGRIVGLVVAVLAVIAAVIFGYSMFEHRGGGPGGNGGLIAAQEGDYKVKPDDPGGMNVQGEGNSAIATSDGAASGNASIDLKAVPEAPVAATKARDAHPAASAASKPVAAVPASGGKLAPAATPAVTHAAPAGAGGALVQLGSFPNEGAANAAWSASSRRFTYLAPLGKSVEKADVAGHTVYRLRVNAGSADQAATLCGKLKVAGEACFVAR